MDVIRKQIKSICKKHWDNKIDYLDVDEAISHIIEISDLPQFRKGYIWAKIDEIDNILCTGSLPWWEEVDHMLSELS